MSLPKSQNKERVLPPAFAKQAVETTKEKVVHPRVKFECHRCQVSWVERRGFYHSDRPRHTVCDQLLDVTYPDRVLCQSDIDRDREG